MRKYLEALKEEAIQDCMAALPEGTASDEEAISIFTELNFSEYGFQNVKVDKEAQF